MSSMSQNAAQTAPASIAKPKNKLFGLSREELKIVTGGGGVIQQDPRTLPFETGEQLSPDTVMLPLPLAPLSDTSVAP